MADTIMAINNQTPSLSDMSTQQEVDWLRILDSGFEHGSFVVEIGPLGLALLLFVLIAIGVSWRWWQQRLFTAYEVVEAELSIANIGKVKIQPNYDNARIAHHAWVELTTRKAALPFDEEHDVITEVYDSYYQLFGKLRELAKSIPAERLRTCSDTRLLVDIMIRVMNEGLRPHLTRWQSRYRRWLAEALNVPENRTKSPQDIQRLYPEYRALVDDLKRLQDDVVRYQQFLKEIAQGNAQ